MLIKKAYYYLFYKFYKMSASAPSKWWSEGKASMAIGVLEIWTIISILIYYKILIDPSSNIMGTTIIWFIIIIAITIADYYIFHHKNKWKNIISEFDKLPRKKNILGSWIVFGLVLLITGNFIFSFYCLDRQARKDQVGPYAPEIVAKERREDSLQKAKQIENLKKIYGEDKK
ncbi:hypothetical protein [Chryseobacterium candidae]|uniref:DUF4234 domain-containing protein n=1 Tax=Chryseobacterium candidae TaxID=1978493 RepID=A0ABY2RBF1_9FLAO|nr:hypothetical protein [Chryseobacterium candidae]THV62928.1 hypothetical protein EK417_03440 [Chryseobacterium candidae]